MNDEQLERYSRHVLLPQFDYDGQEALLKAQVLVLGLGGLGSSAALYLASSGVGYLHLLDPDILELSNLQRQIIHREKNVGMGKVDSAKQSLLELNSSIEVRTYDTCLPEDELAALIAKMDVVLDCTDNSKSRCLHNRLCLHANVPLVSAAAIRFEGQMLVVDQRDDNTPCYQCVYPDHNNQEQSCSTSGILAPVVGLMGVHQALECIKLLSGVGEKSTGTLFNFDGLTGRWSNFNVKKNSQCVVCSNH